MAQGAAGNTEAAWSYRDDLVSSLTASGNGTYAWRELGSEEEVEHQTAGLVRVSNCVPDGGDAGPRRYGLM
jgi:hypothetical protein